MTDLHTHPTAAELLDAAIGYLAGSVSPRVPAEEVYGFRVAMAALAIVARELRSGPSDEAAHLDRLTALGFADDAALAGALRAGEIAEAAMPEVRAALLADAEARLRVSDPRRAPAPPHDAG